MSPRHSDAAPGWIARRFAKIEKQMREDRAAKKLQAATIGKGGLTVKDGGSLSSTYPNGARAARFGPYNSFGPDGIGHGLFLDDENGEVILGVVRYPDTDVAAFSLQGLNFATVTADSLTLYRSDFAAYVDVGPDGATVDGGPEGVKITHSTTGASANAFLDPSDNRIWRSTSSRRYKQDIEDVEVNPTSVLNMRPRTWRDRAEVEKDPDTDRRYVGFIAEELHDLGLEHFVIYDAEGAPEAIAYDRLSVALLAVLKDQESRISALEANQTTGS